MTTFVNHAAIEGPRNGGTDHTVDPSTGTVKAGSTFSPTAGRLLVAVCQGAVTFTTPSGWTLPANGSAVNNAGLYVFYKTAAGSDTLTTTQNGSNYPIVVDFYEFVADSTFVASASETAVNDQGGAGPTLSGLTGTNWVAGAASQPNTSTTNTYAWSWDAGTEGCDASVLQAGAPETNGYQYGLTYIEDDAAGSQAFAATSSDTSHTSVERLVFAVQIAGEATTVQGQMMGNRRRI